MDVKALDKDLAERFAVAIIPLDPVGCLCNFGRQYICGNLLSSLERSNLDLFSRIVWLRLVIYVIGLKTRQ